MRLLSLFGSLLVAAITVAQTQKPSGISDLISVDTPIFVLDHVRVIDGTGAPAKEDQAVVIANGKIQFIGPDASAQIPPGAQQWNALATPSPWPGRNAQPSVLHRLVLSASCRWKGQ
jgi:hypothetical protein